MAKKRLNLAVVLLIVIGLLSAVSFTAIPAAPAKTIGRNKISSEFKANQLTTSKPQEIIVKLKGAPAIPYVKDIGLDPREAIGGKNAKVDSYVRELTRNQLKVMQEIEKICPEAKFGYRYHFTYNGFSVTVPGNEIEKIASLKGIEKVYPTHVYKISGNLSDQIVGAPEVWKMKDKNGNPIDGKGMLIGIIDTGIDYTHPDLGGGFGPKYKVVGGYDFGDNDPDPMDQEGHGTHVAGIAAANGKVKGVAPEAKLMAYKIVSGGNSSASDSTIIAAIERAVKDKCNAVNLSFGSGQLGTANPDDPENKAFDNAADAGVLSAVAAGNQGSRCASTPYPLGAPSGAPKVIAVAASDDGLHPAINIIAPKDVPQNETLILGNYADLSPDFPTDKEFEVVNCGYGRKSDFEGVDVKGKIALVSRGPIGANALYFRDKDLNAEAAGAAGIIIYNNLPGIVSPTFQVTAEDANKKYIPAIFITQDKGMLLRSLLTEGLKIKFTKVSGLGTIAPFSSMGPTSDFFFKPEVSAPGVAINSTIPGGKYAKWDGTSMATPHVTGAIALIKQAHPDWNSAQVKAALMNTATILKNYQNNQVITWTLQGSGRINIPAAITTPAVITPYDILMKVSDAKPITFTITNLSDKPVNFRVKAEFTLGDNTGIGLPAPEAVLVKKGEKKEVTLTFHFDKDKIAPGPHEGAVFFESGNTKLHVPFIFWKGDVEIPKKLSNVSASSDVLSPLSKDHNTITFTFTLGSGSLIPPAEPKDRPTNSNIIDEMQIRIEDMNGNQLGIIYEKALLLLGTYKFVWNGKDIYGNYFLKDGTYKWVVAAVESNNNENNPVVDDAAKVEGTFKVVNAPTTSLSFSLPSATIVQADSTDAALYIETDKKVSSLNATVVFNPNVVKVKKVEPGKLVKDLGSDADFDAKVDNIAGEIKITVTAKNGKFFTGKGAVADITFNGVMYGKTNLSFKGSMLGDESGKDVPCVFVPASLEVKKAPNPWDLNRDKKVDGKDLAIFGKAFGSHVGDPNYLPLADFNGDEVIDGKDLLILAEHYGETYP